MPRPTVFYDYAMTDNLTQTFTYLGVEYTIQNKIQPPESIQDSGYLYSETDGFPLQYWNYQLSGPPSWFRHLDGRLSTGDVHTTTEASPSLTAQLGGTWNYIGSKVVGSDTVYYWKKA